MTDFLLLGSNMDCSHEIKRLLLLEREALINLDQHIKKQIHHFTDKSLYSQVMVFPEVMYRCESQTIKKVEC